MLIIFAVIALVIIGAYFFPIIQNQYGERFRGRKHHERIMTNFEKAFLCPEAHESKEEVLERKRKSRKIADHIIGVSKLPDHEFVFLFKFLFNHLKNVDAVECTLDLLDDDSIYFCLNHNLLIFQWHDGQRFFQIEGEPTLEDWERVEKLQEVQKNHNTQKHDELMNVRNKCDDIINGKTTYNKETVSNLLFWLKNYEIKHSHLRFSRIKETHSMYLTNTKENRKRIKGLEKITKNMS